MQPLKPACLRSLADCKRHLRTRAAALLLGGLAATSLGAAPLETYYVPIPEGDIQEALAELNPNNTSSNIESVVSIALGFGGTIVRYDHQEDGYEADLENPLQATTQIWGDGNPANGAAPGFPGDVFSPGDVLILKNTVPTAPRGNAVLFDAADMFTVTQPVAVTRVAWAPTPGTVLAGAVEVFPTNQWGTMFEAPLGEDFDSSEMFELVTSSIMAAEDGTVVDFDFDANGTTDLTVNLDQGDTFFSPLADGFPLGNRASSNKPIQVHAITGDIGVRWESRWAVVLPLDQWSDEYSLPVSTRESSTEDPTDVFLYNPDPNNAITVSWETTAGAQPNVNVPARGMARVRIPDGPGANDTGTRFFTADNSVFYAVAVIDANDPNSDSNNSDLNNRDYDWGIALLPNNLLSTQALVGFAPGIDPNACSAGAPFDCSTNSNSGGSPVWVMATQATEVFIDFDADPSTGAFTDSAGNQYDTSVQLAALERAKIFDPNDNDMTGALLYTLDGSLLALAWGQDPANSVRTNPYFDAGTIIPGLTTFTLTKDVDKEEAAPGEPLDYTLIVTNTSRANIPNIQLEDELPDFVSYVPDSSTLDGNPFSDSGVTPFPLDEGGAALGDLDPGETFTFTFQVVVDEDIPVNVDDPDDCADPGTRLVNDGSATAIGVTRTDDALTCVVFNPDIELLKQVSLTGEAPFFDADTANTAVIGALGADATYRLIVRNIGDVLLEDARVTDAQLGLVNVPVPGGPLAPGDERVISAGDIGFSALQFLNRCDSDGNKLNSAAVIADVENSDMTVMDTDTANVRCEDPQIEVLKQVSLTGGAPFFDADDIGDPDVPVGTLGTGALYRLIVRNIGTEDLTDVRVSDAALGLNDVLVSDLPAGGEAILDAGDAGFEALAQPNRCDTAGDKPNTAVVTATGADTGTAVNDDDDAWVRCIPTPGIALEKRVSLDGNIFFDADTVDLAAQGFIGDDAQYQLVITNTGDEPLDNLLVSDPTLGLLNVAVPGGELQPQEERTIDQGSLGFSALFFPDRCDSTGIKLNEASVSGSGVISSGQVGDSDPAYVNCVRTAFCAIKVDKKCTPLDDDDDGNGGDDDDDGNGGDDDDDGNGGDDDDDGNGGGDDDDDGNGGGDDDDDGNGGDDDDDGNGGDDDDDGNGGDDDDDGNGGDNDDKDRNTRNIDNVLRLNDDDDDGNGGDDDDDGNGGDDDDDGNGGDDDDDGNGGDDDDDGNGGDDDDDGNGGDDDDDGNGGDDDDDGNGGDDDDDGGHQPPEPRDACTVDAGDRVRYDYSITNTGDTTVSLTSVFDDILLEQLDPVPQLLPVGETLVLSTTATLHETTTNTVTVDGHVDGDDGATCSDSDSVTVTVEPPHDDDDDGNGGDDDDDGNGGDDDDDGNGGDDDDDGNGGDDDDDGNGGGDDDDDGNGGDDDDDGNGGGDDDDDGNGGDDDDDGNGNGDMYGKPTMNFDIDKEVHWELTNNGAEDLHIVNIEVHWPSGHSKLKKMKLNGDFVRRVNDTNSPTLVPQDKSMMPGLWRRTIGAGQTASLVIKFSDPMTSRTESDYQIIIEFSNGEILSH